MMLRSSRSRSAMSANTHTMTNSSAGSRSGTGTGRAGTGSVGRSSCGGTEEGGGSSESEQSCTHTMSDASSAGTGMTLSQVSRSGARLANIVEASGEARWVYSASGTGNRESPLSLLLCNGENQTGSFIGSSSLAGLFASIFLPQGYPASVSEDYLEYQMWDTFQAFCSSITGALATQAILKGVGVGDSAATTAAAAATWMLRDGAGQVGRIVFAWYEGTYLDANPKLWRLIADVLNDAAMLVELISPAFPSIFLELACVASVSRSIVGIAGQASRTSLIVHQARQNNMADVACKDGSQETLVNLIALIVNLSLVEIVHGNPTMIWTLFFLFTFLHIFANYKAVRCVVFDSFNAQRLDICFGEFLCQGRTPSPMQTSARESIMYLGQGNCSIHIGKPLSFILKTDSDLETGCGLFEGEPFMISYETQRGLFGRPHHHVYISIHEGIQTRDLIRAYCEARVLTRALDQTGRVSKNDVSMHYPVLKSVSSQYEDLVSCVKYEEGWGRTTPVAEKWRAVGLCRCICRVVTPGLLTKLKEGGWDMSYNVIYKEGQRIISLKQKME
eukprot:Nk52_evm13s2578 gene=Nk52_evmTU13s2578